MRKALRGPGQKARLRGRPDPFVLSFLLPRLLLLRIPCNLQGRLPPSLPKYRRARRNLFVLPPAAEFAYRNVFNHHAPFQLSEMAHGQRDGLWATSLAECVTHLHRDMMTTSFRGGLPVQTQSRAQTCAQGLLCGARKSATLAHGVSRRKSCCAKPLVAQPAKSHSVLYQGIGSTP